MNCNGDDIPTIVNDEDALCLLVVVCSYALEGFIYSYIHYMVLPKP
jgi:hypothetical protein